jgi:tRNA (guanine-N7-)-methyltransferase
VRDTISATGAFATVPTTELGTGSMSLRPPTKFERRGQRLGHGIWDLLYERRDIE